MELLFSSLFRVFCNFVFTIVVREELGQAILRFKVLLYPIIEALAVATPYVVGGGVEEDVVEEVGVTPTDTGER